MGYWRLRLEMLEGGRYRKEGEGLVGGVLDESLIMEWFAGGCTVVGRQRSKKAGFRGV